MTNLSSVLKQLELERNRLASQLRSLNNALSALNGNGAPADGESLLSVAHGSLPRNALAVRG
jgi:hypothetical protein